MYKTRIKDIPKNDLLGLIDAICSKDEYSKSHLKKICINLGPDYGQMFLETIDQLGLWNQRVNWLYNALGRPEYTSFVKTIYEGGIWPQIGQDEFIPIKSEEDMKKFIESKDIKIIK